ncbi:hypothetical protein ANN_26695 [Periplaneta americana]|uniref:PiggyBac transposable element-derived protein 4 C-terminal zinc-ribbon domain-containing protein n=1 Tax=Periplaneta americana TaxID=6978 RepID=A0ABQ8RYS0_PERAM|nr:hypothetical protein ANN_26695 [Periplaneta americana]
MGKIRRQDFLEKVAWELVKLQMERTFIPQVPIEIRRRGRLLLGIGEQEDPLPTERRSTLGRCYECGRSRNKSTRKWCHKCQKWVCKDHLKEVCSSCFNK